MKITHWDYKLFWEETFFVNGKLFPRLDTFTAENSQHFVKKTYRLFPAIKETNLK
jgi:hypothetical protein